MSRPPRARESVLDAYEAILIDEGPRSASLDATAKAAGVSKGGLLYHFESKDALDQALYARMAERCHADAAAILSSPDGPIAAFVRTSVMTGSPLDRSIVAVSRLALNGSVSASDALRDVRRVWEEMLRPSVRDDTALALVTLLSDGLYFTSALVEGVVPAPVLDADRLDALVELLESVASVESVASGEPVASGESDTAG